VTGGVTCTPCREFQAGKREDVSYAAGVTAHVCERLPDKLLVGRCPCGCHLDRVNAHPRGFAPKASSDGRE